MFVLSIFGKETLLAAATATADGDDDDDDVDSDDDSLNSSSLPSRPPW